MFDSTKSETTESSSATVLKFFESVELGYTRVFMYLIFSFNKIPHPRHVRYFFKSVIYDIIRNVNVHLIK